MHEDTYRQGPIDEHERPAARPGRVDANPVRQAPIDRAAEAKAELLLRLELLEKLRGVPDEVERYVRVYTEASSRRMRCANMVDALGSPLSDAEWKAIGRALGDIRPLSGNKDIRELPEEIASIAHEFDNQRRKASDEIRLALNTAQGPDLERIRDRVFDVVWQMRELIADLADTCSENADELFRQIRDSVQQLFAEIDVKVTAGQAARRDARAVAPAWEATEEPGLITSRVVESAATEATQKVHERTAEEWRASQRRQGVPADPDS